VLRFAYAGRSHPGLVREENEDSGFAGPTLQLVADGVGGAAAGEVASATTAFVTSAMAMEAASRPGTDLVEALTHAVLGAHRRLVEGTAADPGRAGMGTTWTALMTDGALVALGHVGDSRAYLLRDGRLVQLTRDHTLVQGLVDDGLITREEARAHPRRNVVLQAVEATYPPEADVTLLDVRLGDRLLVCSDGLTDLVDDDRIRACLLEPDRDAAVDALVDAALEAGGKDNVTCLVSDLVDGPRLVPDGLLLGALRDPALPLPPRGR
jgi:PPM family protein phosphatase